MEAISMLSGVRIRDIRFPFDQKLFSPRIVAGLSVSGNIDSMRMRRIVFTTLFTALGLLGGACQQPLETGYMPRYLNSSESDRRSYYAPDFTPDTKSGGEGSPAAGMFRNH